MATSRLPLLPPLHALRAFDAAARFGRFREAASALGLSESAVSHQIKRLEAYLGVALFERSGNAVTLTPVGRSYFQEIDPAFVRIRKATEEVRGPAGTARVSLTLPGTLATSWLIPKLSRLEALHPEISLQLITTERILDLRREQINLAIRYGRGPWTGMIAERLLAEQAFPVCAPGYLSGEQLRHPETALSTVRLIINDTVPTEWQSWAQAHGLEAPELRGALVLHASDQTQGAAVEGLGMAMGRRPMVDRFLDAGLLVAPFGSSDWSGAAYFLVHPEVDEPTAPTRKVAKWLQEIAALEPSGNPDTGLTRPAGVR